ncbi:hypothetical protein B0A52_00875 [Exophiala mesophila]|uniref:Uncharacterized protein n=1 Tax=Exophiala mesophila TaxID=212818 RepID=A0A438NIF6_EXOME|nr:hypothetical protein B0A52_00875 [Exophiala mesophila]
MARTILITGCSDEGLGAALATAFHQNGDRVIATARNPAKMSILKSQGIETVTLDVLSEESFKTAVEEVSRLTNNTLDMLINNAGVGYSTPLLEADMVQAEAIFKVNVFAPLRAVQAFMPLLRNSTKGAYVVNNTSIASVTPVPFQGAYGGSKAAIALMTDCLRLELQPFNIRVIELKTGNVNSKFFSNTNGFVGTTAKLSPESIYQPAAEPIEHFMGGSGFKSMPSDVWAQNVVKDLSASNPPSQIWRGAETTKVWMSTWLPHGTMDGFLKQMTGLSDLEKKLKDDGAKKTK